MKNVPVVILCGGTGTRLREETQFTPKPMVPIGGKPMVWHIMKLYAHYGFKRFILALGYKQEVFKHYFTTYSIVNNDVTVYPDGAWACKRDDAPGWEVTLVDTGVDTMKSARLQRVMRYITTPHFMVTYGDGIGDIDITTLYHHHLQHKKIATVTGVVPRSKFGEIRANVQSDALVTSFTEKAPANDHFINAGFYVFDSQIANYLGGGEELETGIMDQLVYKKELVMYPHKGYWGCMDTIKDMHELDYLWRSGRAAWNVWTKKQ